MVEAAVLSAQQHQRVLIDSVIEQARRDAIEKAPDAGIREWLEITAAAELGVAPANK
ncbi:hypothetical protein [Microbacterium sp. YY-01]|uniref:hypothetical protein n=1 Tax=Microbacterium sp. YY-01 TaxID=3421634 RepID=UPI003D16584E